MFHQLSRGFEICSFYTGPIGYSRIGLARLRSVW